MGEEQGAELAGRELKISEMRPAVRDPQRVNVYVNGKFEFSLEVTQVVELGVKVGQILDVERLAELRRASEFGKVYQRALEWALARPRSVQEVRDYLRLRQVRRRQLNRQREREEKRPLAEISDEVAGLVAERLVERGYVDDQKFAEFVVENRRERGGVSERKLRIELRQKGVADEIVARVLAERPHDEMAEVRRLVQKKGRRYDAAGLVKYLMRQGFSYDVVRSVVEEEAEDSVEERARGAAEEWVGGSGEAAEGRAAEEWVGGSGEAAEGRAAEGREADGSAA